MPLIGPPKPLKPRDAIKTYRYLRIGIIGAIVLLAISILIEHFKVANRAGHHCWQTSISAYYYTPVRGILVGSLFVIGFALIVYKGRTDVEDFCLNVAGMLAPIVAVMPTTDIGNCASASPGPDPYEHRALAPWLITTIDNNFRALVITGFIGVILAAIIAWRGNKKYAADSAERVKGWTFVFLGLTALLLIGAWLLSLNWSQFYTRAHGWAANALFVFLFATVVVKAMEHESTKNDNAWSKRLYWGYWLIAACMLLGALVSWIGDWIFGNSFLHGYNVGALEAWEIFFFAAFWVIQTIENWNEPVIVRVPEAVQAGEMEVRLTPAEPQ